MSRQPGWMNLLQMKSHRAEGGVKRAGLKVDKKRKCILQQPCLRDSHARGEQGGGRAIESTPQIAMKETA